MPDETAFLAAIRQAPDDRDLRLVYADWLEARADARGELIRVEEEMRDLPVFGDRFWLLKPRRNELRAQTDPGWLEAMRIGTDCEPVFRHKFPEDWRGRWRLIREFVERWYRIPLGDVGGRADEIREAEAKLRRTLPPSFREWVAFAHDVRKSHAGIRVVLRDIFDIRHLPDLAPLSVMLPTEGDFFWAIRHADFEIPDPPIHGFSLDAESARIVASPVEPIAGSLTQFALRHAMGYSRGGGGGFGTIVEDSAGLIRDLEAAFPIRCRLGEGNLARPGDAELYEAPNILVRRRPVRGTQGRKDPASHLDVEVARPLPRESIPALLWAYSHRGGIAHGMFDPR